VVKKSILAFATLALAVASAASSYQQGKTVTEVPVKVETNTDKYAATSVRLNGTQVEEIRLGGTNKKLVFEKTGAGTN
jgi:hypothetical protein